MGNKPSPQRQKYKYQKSPPNRFKENVYRHDGELPKNNPTNYLATYNAPAPVANGSVHIASNDGANLVSTVRCRLLITVFLIIVCVTSSFKS